MTISKKIKVLAVFIVSTLVVAKPAFCQMQFVENKGQWDSKVSYRGDMGSGAFYLEKKGFTVQLHNPEDLHAIFEKYHGHIDKDKNGQKAVPENNQPLMLRSHAYKVSFAGAAENILPVTDKQQPGINNYFLGDDHTKWAGNCRIYEAITYQNIYPGIDVRYYTASGNLKYDIIVHPGADPGRILMQYDGIDKLSTRNKELIIGTSIGEVKELYPYSYEVVDGKRNTVDCKYVVTRNQVSFKVSGRSAGATLVIDPTVIFSTFTGSRADNWGTTATPGPGGTFFAGGIAFGAGYPTSLGAYQTTFGGGVNEFNNPPFDMAIFKFSADGKSRIYATYLGGLGNEQPHSLICDATGKLIIAGRSSSPNYPKTIPQIGIGGGYDIVISELSASGGQLLGSVKIGGNSDDGVNIRDKYDGVRGTDLIRRNYGDDARSEVILDNSGNIYLASCSKSTDFPVTPGLPVQSSFGGGRQDGVILKFAPDLSSMLFSTYFGGSGDDACFVLSINPLTGLLYVGGATTSPNLPGDKTGVKFGTFQGGETDGYVTVLQSDGSALVRTTYLGGTGADMVYGLKFDKFGFPYVMGTTTVSWPVINATYSNAGGKQFIAKLQPDLSNFVYSTNFGTNSTLPNISPVAFLVDRCENVYVSGWGGEANTGQGYPSAGTLGMPIKDQLPGMTPDGNDFYFFVLEKNANSIFFGSTFGQFQGNYPEHVDGGTSRFDNNGIIYQAICANCGGGAVFPTTPGVWSTTNGSDNCNEACVKIEMNFTGVGAAAQATINGVVDDTSGCTPLLVRFSDTLQKGKQFVWDFGDNSPKVFLNGRSDTSHIYTAPGYYRVMLVAIDSATCNIADTAYLTIKAGNNKASLDFSTFKLPPCTNLTYQFTNLSTASFTGFGAKSFIWDYGDGTKRDTVGLIPPRVHTYASPGTYKVKLIVSDTLFCNSPDSITKTIRINPTVKASFNTPPRGCVPYEAVFENTSLAGTDFLWEFGDNTTSTLVSPTHLYPNPGQYQVRLIATDTNTCNKVDTSAYFTITVYPNPVASFTWAPNPPRENTPTRFTNLSIGAVRYLWNFGDGEKSTEVNPVHQYNATGNYAAELIAYNEADCTDTFKLDVPAIIIPLLDVPNAFTPGRNGVNGVVKVAGFGIGKMIWRIYNRWGQMVFSTTDRNQGWDGTFKGALQPLEVYTYTLDVEFTDGKKLKKTGDITLLR